MAVCSITVDSDNQTHLDVVTLAGQVKWSTLLTRAVSVVDPRPSL